MENKIRKTLDDVIEVKLRNLTTLSYEGDERSAAIKDLTELYKLRIEEAKLEADVIDKERQRALEEESNHVDKCVKDDQLRAQSIDRWLGVGVQVGLGIMSLFAYDRWFKRGLKFEETGTIGSPMTRNLLAKMLPKK